VMSSKTAVRMVELLGAKPVPIPFGELYSALDTGTVDGAENNAPSLYSSKQYEVASFYSLNEHARVPDVLVIGTETWNRLGPQEQQWLKLAAHTASIEQRKLWIQADAEALQEMQKAGLQIGKTIDREAFRKRMAPLYADRTLVTPEVDAYVQRIRAQSKAGQ
jgi:TRAP-type C4-dicarboxylate transport system substrate-binding protein